MAPYFSSYLRNARIDGQSITNRPGHTLHATLTAGSYPKGIWTYIRSNPANNKMVVRHNTDGTHKLYTVDSAGATVSIDTGADIASDNRMTFTNIGDVIYCMNGADDFGKLSDTTYTTPSTWVASFAPSFSVVFNSSHWASWWATNPNLVYKSVGNNYEDFNSSGAEQYSFQEQITWLATNGDALYYFTPNTVSKTGKDDIIEAGWALTYATRTLEVSGGSVNHASIVVANKRVFFVTPSNKICVIAEGQPNGKDSVELSERSNAGITKLMATLDPDQTDCFWYFLPKENLIKWFFKKINSTFHDICIIYDVIKNAFLVDTQKFFYGWVHFEGANYTISMIEPKVFRDEYARDDEDSPIPFTYRTKIFYPGSGEFKYRLRQTQWLVDINQLAVLTQKIYIDSEVVNTKVVDLDNLPASVGGVGTSAVAIDAIGTGTAYLNDMFEVPINRPKGTLNKKWRTLMVERTNNTVGGKVRLKSFMPKMEILPEMANSLTY